MLESQLSGTALLCVLQSLLALGQASWAANRCRSAAQQPQMFRRKLTSTRLRYVEAVCTTSYSLVLSQLVHQSWELMLQISDAHKSNADLSSGVIQAGQSQLYACRCIE